MNFKFLLLTVSLLLVFLFKSNAQPFTGSGNSMLFYGTATASVANRIQTPLFKTAPDKFTIEFWIRPYTVVNYGPSFGTESVGQLYVHCYSTGQIKVARNTNDAAGDYFLSPINTVVANQWQHFAITYDATGDYATNPQVKMYKNGVPVANVNTGGLNGYDGGTSANSLGSATEGRLLGTIANPDGLLFGHATLDGTRNINGDVDEFRVWKTVRTQDEIVANKDKELDLPNTDLLLYLKFNDTSSESNFIKDYSSNNTQCTLYNNVNTTAGATNSSITVLNAKQIQLNVTLATPVAGKKMYVKNEIGTTTATIDVMNTVSSASNLYVYAVSPALDFNSTYTLEVESNAFTSSSRPSSLAFTRPLSFSYWYELSSSTYPAANATNVPLSLSSVIVAFSNPTIQRSTSGSLKIMDSKTWVEKANASFSSILNATTPFTVPLNFNGNLELGKNYTIVVEKGSFVSSDGIEENQRIWSFNTIATTAANKVLVMTGTQSSLVTVLDAATNTTSASSLSIPSTYTQEVWFKFNSLPTGWASIIPPTVLGGTGNNYRSPCIYLYTNKQIQYGFGTGSTWGAFMAAGYEKGWNHIAATFDGVNCNAYINGCLVNTTTTNSGLSIANPIMKTIGGYAGSIDEIKIWKKALSQQEIRDEMYKTYTKAEAESKADLIGYWNFDDGLANTEDLSINNNALASVGDYATNDNSAWTQFLYEGAVAPLGTTVAQTANVYSLKFNRAIVSATGSLKLTNLSTGTVSTVDIASTLTTGYREADLVTSSVALEYSSTYSVEFVDAKFYDFSGNVYSGGAGVWTFNVVAAPSITELAVNANSSPSSTFSITVNRAGSVIYKIVSSTATAPTITDLNNTGTSVTVASGTRSQVSIGNLAVGTYKVYATMNIENIEVYTFSNTFTLIAPVLTITEKVPDRTSISVKAKGDRVGVAYYVAVESSATVPDNTTILSSVYTTNISIANLAYSGSISGLKKSTAYKICSVFKDVVGNLSPVSVSDVVTTTSSLIAPTISSIGNKKQYLTSVTFDVTCAEEGTLYWVILPATVTTAPVATAIFAMASNGTVSSGTTTTGVAPITYETAQTFSGINLDRNTQYVVYVVAKNANGVYDNVLSASIKTTDGDPVIVRTGSGDILTSNRIKIGVKSSSTSRPGKFYWVVLNSSSAAPASGQALKSMVTTPTSASVTTGAYLTSTTSTYADSYGLTPNTSYVLYVVMFDGSDTPSNILTYAFTTVGIGSDLESGDITIYPNPAKDVVSISYNLLQSSEVSFDLYTSLGVKVKSSLVKQTKGEQKMTLDVNDLSNGTYIYQLRTANGTISKQLIINR